MLQVNEIKKNFPIFRNRPELVYLDSAATSLKPLRVISKLTEYYEEYSANVFRGIYDISEVATREYEDTRIEVANFIGAKHEDEIIFTRNATESFNLVAYSLGRKIIREDDEIITTVMEHHSNFVPWQQLAFENGAIFKVIDITKDGYLNIGKNIKHLTLNTIITKNTKILALTYVSNVLGTINPVKDIIKEARRINPNIIVVVDAAQAVPHLKINVTDLDADFLAFSSHKMLGPTGVGVLWGRRNHLREMFPFLFGGEMISQVTIETTTFVNPPHKFEAGTPDIAGVIALKEAIAYLKEIGMDEVRRHEMELVSYAKNSLENVFGPDLMIVGPSESKNRGGVISFTYKDFHPHDIAQIVDEASVCIRAGHHCAMPLHKRLGLNATCRMSFYLYNSKEDIDKLVEGLKKVDKILMK